MTEEAPSPLGPTQPGRAAASRRDILVSAVTAAAAASAAAPALAQGAASPNLRFINPSTIAKPPGYTHVIEVTGPGRTVYIAGQTGRDATGKLAGAPGDFRAQATQAFENLKNALAAVGAGFEHVVKLNNYLVDIAAHFPIYREVRDAYVNKENPPVSTTVQVGKLARDDLLFEVEAIAVLPPT
jgi:enamine deaminase RidA (YjgF/YER057c/UK114 family)